MINVDAIADPYFRDAALRHAEVYRNHFGERLCAVYVWGSVHRNEAVRPFSDLDLHAFIQGVAEDADALWYDETRAAMERAFPGLAGLTRPLPVRLLRDGKQAGASEPEKAVARALGFRLRYDATRLWGDELVTETITPVPDKAWARGPFEAVRDLARFDAGLDHENKTDFALPRETLARLRKLARLAVLGGGYLLMAHEEFRSFKGADVLPALRNALPEWELFLTETARLYILPPPAEPGELNAYRTPLVRWLDFVHQRLNAGDVAP